MLNTDKLDAALRQFEQYLKREGERRMTNIHKQATSDADMLRKIAQIRDIGRLVSTALMVCERHRGEEEYDALKRQIALECAMYVSGAHTYGEAVSNIQRSLNMLALALDIESEPQPE